MNLSVQYTGEGTCSVVWLVRDDPYACRDRFFAESRAGKTVNVREMITWEVDYLRLLFPHARWSWVDDPGKLAVLTPDVVVFNSNTFTLNEDTFRDWAPRILVYLSDEWGRTPHLHEHMTNISLVLRQYHHSHYVQATNVRQIPLGFINTMFDDSLKIPDFPLATDRRYRWCFVGTMTRKRVKAVRAFASWGPCFRDPCPPHELARVYQNSVFTLCPRGNVMMDCFRNYEATLCGSIPVVAGCSKREFQESFAYADVPPWVHACTWQRARMICEDFEKTGALKELQQACLKWWWKEIATVRDAIADVLGSPLGTRSPATVSAARMGAMLRWKLASLMRCGRRLSIRKINTLFSSMRRVLKQL
jgi:hypothetical protein